ncbi:GOLD domain-containing protein [Plasmodiophora brassicae]
MILHSGVTGFHFTLSDDGGTAIVEFEWHKCSYNALEMFKEEMETEAIKDYHPKIAAIKAELEQADMHVLLLMCTIGGY